MTARRSAAGSAPSASSRTRRKPSAQTPLERLRSIIGAWPETREKISHGAPTWWGGRKTFATLHEDHHGDGRLAVWIKTTHETQADLVEADPERFFVPPYVGVSGWVGVRLDTRPTRAHWGVVADLLEEGYRSVAPARATRALDAQKESKG